jgi:hypothetical protein
LVPVALAVCPVGAVTLVLQAPGLSAVDRLLHGLGVAVATTVILSAADGAPWHRSGDLELLVAEVGDELEGARRGR